MTQPQEIQLQLYTFRLLTETEAKKEHLKLRRCSFFVLFSLALGRATKAEGGTLPEAKYWEQYFIK